MKARIYIEGGGDSKELHTRCREGFRQLFDKCGFQGRMPRLVACGGREATFDDFKTAHRSSVGTGEVEYVAMLVDSEVPVADVERTWDHLAAHDGWHKPEESDNDQVLFMTTCMETWITADRKALKAYYSKGLRERMLPELLDMESRGRKDVQNALARATEACKRNYRKGRQSFEVLAKLEPATLRQHLPSFARCERILRANLR